MTTYRPALTATLLTLLANPGTAAQTDNHGVHAVPAPATMAIDGKLDEWDLSGEIQMCYDLESLADVYSAKAAMMYDATNLYLAIHWKDPIPLGNSHDPRYQANKGWAGDCVQLRIKTDRITHATAWYYAPKQQSFIHLDFGKSLSEPFGGGSRMLFSSDGWKLSDGAEQAFAKDADGRGYVQEMKLPWALITSDGKAPAERFACGFELLWGESDWPVHRYADNLAEGTSSREFFWTAHNAWGPVIMEKQGRLTLPRPAYLAAMAADEAQGPVAIPYTLPAAARVTMAIDDAQGRRVRNLTAAQPRQAGANAEHWDGLDDAGKPVPAGDYRFTGLHHGGIHANWIMSFCSPGNPPWTTADGRGAFYADHTAPQGAAAAGDFVALACPMGEGGQHLIGCDLEGQRLWGLANRVAFDGGHISLATDGKILWVANDAKESTIYRVEIATGQYAPWKITRKDAEGRDYQVLDLKVSDQPGFTAKGSGGLNLAAVAVRGGTLAVCLTREGKVKLLDAETAEVRQEIAIPAPRSVAFLPDGALIVLTQDGLMRVEASGATHPFATIGGGEGYAVATDAAGNVYLSLRGARQNVQVFSADGKPARSIGRAGGRPLNGPFIDDAMRDPAQIAVDSRGRLWVTEETVNPKRTSIWNAADGAFVKDLVGTTSYAGAGSINPADPTMAFSEQTVFRIDLATGAWRPVYSLAHSGHADDLFPPKVHEITNRTITRDGVTLVYTTDSARGSNEVHCTLFKDGRWRSAAHLGTVAPRDHAEQWRKYSHPAFQGHGGEAYAWSDANGDGLVQAEELAFAKPAIDGKPARLRSFYWGQLPDNAGTIAYMADGANALYEFPITGTTACGAPRYDIANPRVVKADRPVLGGGNGEGMLIGGNDGVFYLNQDPLIAIAADGRVLGGYPNHLTSVHGSHEAKSPHAGYLIGPSSILGTADLGGEIGEVFYLNGNLGENYLFTRDGLWIQGLFKDTRGWFEMPAQAVRGMAFDATSGGGESFGGNFVRAKDGKTYATLCGTDARVIEITGLTGIKRLSGAFTYTPAQFQAAQAFIAERAAKTQETRAFAIAKRTATVTIDGKGDEWPELKDDAARVVEVQESKHLRYGRVALRWDDEALWLAYRVFAPEGKLRNTGQNELLMFKTGDCVDLMLATPGAPNGLRLLFSTLAGKPLAMLYEKTVPGTPEAQRVPFSSPARSIYFDRVTQPGDVQMATAGFDRGYLVEARVPWKRLGVTPAAGLTLRGDLGLLFADHGGTITNARHYWSNQATGLVNDVPGEADLTPRLWGSFTLE
jgi:hypothetical protein